MSGPLIQNFTVPAGDLTPVDFDISPDASNTLDNCVVYLSVYEQVYGLPVVDVPPVIEKTSLSGGDIDVTDAGHQRFTVTFVGTDTVALLGNYYHEVTIVDAADNKVTVTVGIMTVTQTENRP